MDEKEAEARPLMGTIFLVEMVLCLKNVIGLSKLEALYICICRRYVSYVK